MRQLFYSLVYNRHLNYMIRNILKPLKRLLPASIQIPPSGMIRLRAGKKSIKIATNQTNYVTHLVFWKGFKQFEYTDIFCDLVKKIRCFYDIGANIGYYSLLAAAINPGIKVISFEAAEGPLYYLRKNIEINKLNNIYPEPLAISDSDGEVEFIQHISSKYRHLDYNLGGEGHVGKENASHDTIRKKVRSITLDKYVRTSGEKNIDLIKIDTEGTEDLILKYSECVIKEWKPIIICETLFNRIEPGIEEIASSYDYLFFNHYHDGLRNVDTIKRTYDDGVRNCFLVHPSKVDLITDYLS
ncbi:MAG: FkbM family methyltransferase [Bacteroidales bacterium]|nr:FkbM family methyltransferase [Bacteroidales bacterium]